MTNSDNLTRQMPMAMPKFKLGVYYDILNDAISRLLTGTAP